MSTYGFALIADLADVEDAERVLSQVRDVLAEDWDRSWGSDPFDQFASEVVSGDGGARLTVLASMMLPNGHEDQFFAGTSGGRAVVCEDLDEYGVMFSVWGLAGDAARCVYRAHVHDPEDDPVEEATAMTVTGADAAASASDLFDCDPAALLALEQDGSPVADQLGIVGDPFEPWLSALGLAWPELDLSG